MSEAMKYKLPPLPKPDTHCFDEDTGKDVWSHSPDQMQAYAIAAIKAQTSEVQQKPLTDEQIEDLYFDEFSISKLKEFASAIESEVTEPLLQRIAELEAANEAFVKRQNQWNLRMIELERQLEEARKDAERLDYIQKNARSDPKMDGNHVWWPTTFNQAQNLKGPTIRAAIDAAMQKGQS